MGQAWCKRCRRQASVTQYGFITPSSSSHQSRLQGLRMVSEVSGDGLKPKNDFDFEGVVDDQGCGKHQCVHASTSPACEACLGPDVMAPLRTPLEKPLTIEGVYVHETGKTVDYEALLRHVRGKWCNVPLPLSQLLHGFELPDSATHVIVYVWVDQVRAALPFSLKHQSDALFPGAVPLKLDGEATRVRMMPRGSSQRVDSSKAKAPENALVTDAAQEGFVDVTGKLGPLTHDGLHLGQARFVPEAWSFVCDWMPQGSVVFWKPHFTYVLDVPSLRLYRVTRRLKEHAS